MDVIPGTEVATAEGDLPSLNATEKIQRGRALVETVLTVGDLGGFCVAQHPMADGLGMKSLSVYSILNALRNSDVVRTLIAIESWNTTILDRMSNHYARILADRLDIAQTASSDAHVIEAIGLGTTEFDGHTAQDLITALKKAMSASWGVGQPIMWGVRLHALQMQHETLEVITWNSLSFYSSFSVCSPSLQWISPRNTADSCERNIGMIKHILVTNNDGVLAPGLLALTREMRKFEKVSVIAPDRNWPGGRHV